MGERETSFFTAGGIKIDLPKSNPSILRNPSLLSIQDKMPYSADLRCSYCSSELNMGWLYEYLRERDEDITFDTKEIEDEFNEFIDNAFNKWVVYKVFNHKQDDMIDRFECVWDYLRDKTIDFAKENPAVLFKFCED